MFHSRTGAAAEPKGSTPGATRAQPPRADTLKGATNESAVAPAASTSAKVTVPTAGAAPAFATSTCGSSAAPSAVCGAPASVPVTAPDTYDGPKSDHGANESCGAVSSHTWR